MAPSTEGNQGHWVTSQTGDDAVCNKGTQNAQKYLEDTLGKGKEDTAAPKLWFIRPGQGAVMPQDFSFEVTAGNDLGLEHITIYVDGKKELEAYDPPFTGILRKVADGEHTLKAKAFDWVGKITEASITITVVGNCVGTGSCHAGTGGITAPCTDGTGCISGICAVKGGEGTCVDTCNASAETPVCPAGLSCKKVGEQDACVPGDGYTLAMTGSDDGGCRVSSAQGTRGEVWLLLVGSLALLGLALRRRRTKRRSFHVE